MRVHKTGINLNVSVQCMHMLYIIKSTVMYIYWRNSRKYITSVLEWYKYLILNETRMSHFLISLSHPCMYVCMYERDG